MILNFQVWAESQTIIDNHWMSSKDKTNEFVLFDKSNPMFVFS